MTPEEAIKRIENHIEVHSRKEPHFAIRIIEALKMAIEALRKRIPKKVEFVDGGEELLCPCCKYDLMGCEVDAVHAPYYCLECGQALDWSGDAK